MSDADVEKDWNEFWVPLIDHAVYPDKENPKPGRWMVTGVVTGVVRMNHLAFAQIKRELFDWHVAMGEVSRVYSEITGGNLSKPNTAAYHVISFAEEERQEQVKDAVNDFLCDLDVEDMHAETIELFAQQLLEHFEISLDDHHDYAKKRERIQTVVTESKGDQG